MITRFIAAIGLTALLLSSSGCSVDPETLESLQSAVSSVAGTSNQEALEPAAARPAAATAEVSFQPPHPEREDPFTFPDGADVARHQSGPTTNIAEVEILGFAKVGEQHVLLRSGEKSRSLTVGESIDGVRVLDINPPSVRLQIGTLIWTATMFDKAPNE